jgi:hypothetical protein
VSDARRTEGEPHDRLTRIGDGMIAAFDSHPEQLHGDRAMIFLDDGDERGGIALAGWENDAEAVAALLLHLKALFEANGRTLLIAPLGGDG